MAIVKARIPRTSRDPGCTEVTTPTIFTNTLETVDHLDTGHGSVSDTRIRTAFVEVAFAARPRKAGPTKAAEPVDPVDARAAVLARPGTTVVDVDFT